MGEQPDLMAQHIGERLRRLRDAFELTQEALALDLGISRSRLAAWERGYRSPRLADADRLAAYFGVPLEALTRMPAAEFQRLLDAISDPATTP